MEYYESQRFRQWWVLLILAVSLSLPLIIGIIEYFSQSAISGETTRREDLILFAGFALFGLFVFLSFRLETRINARGIHYRFFPVHLRFHTILWDEVAEVFVREYQPIREYGGWGIRFGLFNKTGKAYNVSGNRGIQIILKNGKKVLIGTQNPHEVQLLLDKLHNSR